MFLLIGHHNDPCIVGVDEALRERGETTLIIAEPLANDNMFAWSLDARGASSRLRMADGHTLRHADWRGVLVRLSGGPVDITGWQPDDLAYMQAEGQAALLAWLRSVPCPVVNPPLADTWLRSWRPAPEQHGLFARAALPASPLLVTNDAAAARHFAAQWGGAATYTSMTTATQYLIDDARQWRELERVMVHLPICLTAPPLGACGTVTYAGGRVVWSAHLELSAAQRAQINTGMNRLAGLLQVELLQITLEIQASAAWCRDLNIRPQFERHSEQEQQALAEGIAVLLRGEPREEAQL